MRVALGIVALLSALGIGFGVAAGISDANDVTAGVSGRPFIYWMIAAAYLVLCTMYWPALLSWFVAVDTPTWHRKLLVSNVRQDRFEHARSGRTILAFADSLDSGRRPGVAGRALLMGFLYVLISLPLPLALGIAALKPGQLQLSEAVPLAVASWGPAVLTATILVRSRLNPGRGAEHKETPSAR